jgi:Transglycosylase SLT domain
MTTYTYAQLEELWEEAGGPSDVAPLMAAIAMAESSGNSNAYNSSGASGLWQILGAPDGWTGSTDWFNPITNAQAAVAKYETQGLSAWTTYTSGAYKQFYNGSVPPATGGTGVSTTSSNSVDPSTALSEMGELFHGAAQGLNWAFWLFEPGQGWRALFAVGGIGSGVFAAKLYTSPSVSQEKSAAFPAAILFTGVCLLCLYMTMRSWPVNSDGAAIRPATYLVGILKGEKPPAGPSPTDNTNAIQEGLEAIASIWVVNKVASSISGLAGAAGVFGGIWAGIKSVFGGGGGEGATEIPDIPLTSLTVPNAPGVTAPTGGVQTV